MFLVEIFTRASDNFSQLITAPTFILLFFLLIIWLVGMFFKRIGLPIMLGEMLAGLILGPPVLGIIQPSIHIEWLAELGVFFLMFFTGMEIDPEKLKKTSFSAVFVAFGGTLLPFLAGYFISRNFGSAVPQALFIGMVISVTSIATKARILHELKLLNKKVGHLMVNAALYDNIFSFILFAGIIGFVKVGSFDFMESALVGIEILVFLTFTILFGHFIFPRLEKYFSHKGTSGFTFCLIIALLFGFLAELANLHFIIGVFIAGIFVRKDVMTSTALYNRLFETMYAISYGFLGPIFFLTLSFHVDFQIIFTEHLSFLFFLTGGAIIAKVLGASLSARLTGYNSLESLIVGFGMNCRGLVEIIMVLIGIELGVLNKELVSILVIIAIITTLTTPLFLKFLAVRKNLVITK